MGERDFKSAVKKERFKIVPASYLVLIEDGKILMLRRFNTGFEDGKYGLVSGHLDGGETFRETMVREAREEANITLCAEDLEVVHVLNRHVIFNDVGHRERVDLFIRPGKWEGKIKNMEPDKCDDLSWFPIDSLPGNTIPVCTIGDRKYPQRNFLQRIRLVNLRPRDNPWAEK
ncbi:MAG: NUDIX domain-containing protein [Parcubacteria group bacterium]